MTALLTSTDFAGMIPPETLVQLSTSNGSVVDEAVIAACASDAWNEMWTWLAVKFFQPATVPDGDCKTLLKTITRYYLYGRRPETDPQNDIPGSPNIIKASYQAAIKRIQAAAGPGNATIAGLTLLTPVTTTSTSSTTCNNTDLRLTVQTRFGIF